MSKPLTPIERKAWSETTRFVLNRATQELSELAAKLYGAGTLLSNVDLIAEAKEVWAMRMRLASLSSVEYFPETPAPIPPPEEVEPLPEGVTELQVEAVERGLQSAETKEDLLHYAGQIKSWNLPKDSPRRIRLVRLYSYRLEMVVKHTPAREPGEDDMEGEEAPPEGIDPIPPEEPALQREPGELHSRDKLEINRDGAAVFQDPAPKPPAPKSVQARRRAADKSRREFLVSAASLGKKALNGDEHANIDEAVELLLGACVLPHLATAQKAIAALLVSDAGRALLDRLVEMRRSHIEEALKEGAS